MEILLSLVKGIQWVNNHTESDKTDPNNLSDLTMRIDSVVQKIAPSTSKVNPAGDYVGEISNPILFLRYQSVREGQVMRNEMMLLEGM